METNKQDQARNEDFEFMVLCASKGNMAMYELLRDRSLDEKEQPQEQPQRNEMG